MYITNCMSSGHVSPKGNISESELPNDCSVEYKKNRQVHECRLLKGTLEFCTFAQNLSYMMDSDIVL